MPGNVGAVSTSLAARDALDHAQRVLVVVVRAGHHLEHDRDGGHHERREQRVPERVDRDEARKRRVGDQQRGRVDEQHEHEAEREHVRQPQRGDDRREHGVQNGDRGGDQKRRAGAVELHTRKQAGGDIQGGRRNRPRDE